MDATTNPFSPGAGTPPPELVGRDPILEEANILFQRVKRRRASQSMLLTGLRGVGKTVLLNEIERLGKKAGYQTISCEAHEGSSLGILLAPHLRTLLYKLDRRAGASRSVKRGLAVLRSFVGPLRVSSGEFTIELAIEPEAGSADSGDLEVDLPQLFVAIAEAAADRDKAVAVLIDEIHYFTKKELGALIMAMHQMQQRQLPMVLLGAGLPILPGLAGKSKFYAERLFNFPEVGELTPRDSAKALRDPAAAEGVLFEEEALEEIYRHTRGYPYFVQEWGYQSWNLAEASPINQSLIKSATRTVIPRLDQSFFRVRFDRLSSSEKTFLRAMAELGPGPHRTGDIARSMNVKAQSLSPRRARLIEKGMTYSPAHGKLAFTVPMFNDFLIRAMPEFHS